jgi:hypothetical protein
MDHIVNRYSRTLNWQKELHGSHCKPILQNGKLTDRAAWNTLLSAYRSGVSVYNMIHAALSVSLPFWSIGLQCDPCCSFCQLTVLEYRFTMWSMLLFLSVYRSGVSVYNVIHGALSVSLPFWSIGLQWSILLFLSLYRSGVSVYTVIHAALSVSLLCKPILQNGKLTERAAWITLYTDTPER